VGEMPASEQIVFLRTVKVNIYNSLMATAV
jgi:hypothetical protein